MKQSELKNIMEYSILSCNYLTGKVIASKWTETLIEKIAKAYSVYGNMTEKRKHVERTLLDGNSIYCPNATFTLVRKDSVRHCVRCENAFVISDTMPDRIYCSEACWQYEKSMSIQRDNEDNIIAGRMRHAIEQREMGIVLNCLIYQDDSCRIYAYHNPEQEAAIIEYESCGVRYENIQYVPAYNERHAAYLIVRW